MSLTSEVCQISSWFWGLKTPRNLFKMPDNPFKNCLWTSDLMAPSPWKVTIFSSPLHAQCHRKPYPQTPLARRCTHNAMHQLYHLLSRLTGRLWSRNCGACPQAPPRSCPPQGTDNITDNLLCNLRGANSVEPRWPLPSRCWEPHTVVGCWSGPPGPAVYH
jgi:hypothetical protein